MKNTYKPRLPFKGLFCLFAVLLLTLNYSFAQKKLQKQINTLPWHEDFNSAAPPELPQGWTSIIKSDSFNAFVQTTTTAAPVAPPNQVRMFNSTDASASLYLVSPEIVPDISQLRIRFYSFALTGANNILEVGTINIAEDENFTMIQSITLNNQHTLYMVNFDSYTGNDQHFAFKVIPDAQNRNVYIDKIIVDQIPTGPLVEVSPMSRDFGHNQIGVNWHPETFTITNAGIGNLVVDPSDITISGADASDFILHNLTAPFSLAPFESTTIGVSFAPQTVGEKNAILNVQTSQTSLMGIGIDETITEFPHFMNFNDVTPPALPAGWSSFVNSSNASARVESTNVGQPVTPPNQMRFVPMNDPGATLLFISPPFEIPINRLRISFQAYGFTSESNKVEIGSYCIQNGFTPITTTNITSAHQNYQVDLDQYEGSEGMLAIRGVSNPASGRVTYLDNLLFDTIPLFGLAAITPGSFDFGPVHYGQNSEEKVFTITNTGLTTLTLTPSDISITGNNASDFVLNNISGTLELELNQSATVGVVFSPEDKGSKEAVLMVKGTEAALSGFSYDPNINELPHQENFIDLVTPPALPPGWTSFMQTTSTQAVVQTNHLMNPLSQPWHIRFGNFTDADANLVLITPEIEFDLSQLRVGFWAKVNSVAASTTFELGVWEPEKEINSFTPITSILLTTDYTYYFFDLEDYYQGDAVHLAFRPVFNATYRWVTMDNFSLDFAPLAPELTVDPEQHTFLPWQVGTISPAKQFTISNTGGDTLLVAPSDLSIIGDDATEFHLHNLTDTVRLTPGQTAQIAVAFAPETLGEKQAMLMLQDKHVPLSGQAFDATVTQLPFTEDFSGLAIGAIPFGWVRSSQNWGVVHTNNAGGNSPEMRFHFNPTQQGTFYLKSPLINLTGHDQLLLTFRHMVNNFMTPGIYNLRVITMVGDNEYLVHQWVDPDDIMAESHEILITSADHGVGAENLRIAFVFDGNTADINHWFIDNIILREVPDYFTASFQVLENSPAQESVENAIINIPGHARLYTDENGLAAVTLEAGIYFTEVIKHGYAMQTFDLELTDGDLTQEVKLQDRIAMPVNLDFDENNTLSWDLETITDEFRYDDGVAVNQLGITGGNINSVLGAAHPYAARLYEISWMTTPVGGPHHVVKIWVLGLDEYGWPDRTQILYEAENVENVDNQWSTYQFSQPIDTQNGFYIGLSYGGFLALAIDNGLGEPWEFKPRTHFGVGNILDPLAPFLDIGEWDVPNNFLLRAYGDNLGTIEMIPVPQKNLQSESLVCFGDSAPEPFIAEAPKASYGTAAKALSGFNIFLNDMSTPVAQGVTAQQYVFDLEPGNYTAGVQAVYTTGISEIVTLDFEITEIPVFVLSFSVKDEDGEEISDAVITLEGTAHPAGEYAFPGLEAGTYGYTVSRGGYHGFSSQAVIDDQDKLVEVVLARDNVSVNDPHSAYLSIFPNPASSRISIVSAETINEISLISISGQVVKALQPNAMSVELNVSVLKKGIYFLRIADRNGHSVRKVVIK